jgi:hypothetical protein
MWAWPFGGAVDVPTQVVAVLWVVGLMVVSIAAFHRQRMEYESQRETVQPSRSTMIRDSGKGNTFVNPTLIGSGDMIHATEESEQHLSVAATQVDDSVLQYVALANPEGAHEELGHRALALSAELMEFVGERDATQLGRYLLERPVPHKQKGFQRWRWERYAARQHAANTRESEQWLMETVQQYREKFAPDVQHVCDQLLAIGCPDARLTTRIQAVNNTQAIASIAQLLGKWGRTLVE